MTYAGLTKADKPALLDAKARGAEWVARDKYKNGLFRYFNKPERSNLFDGIWKNADGDEKWKHVDDDSLPFIQWSDAEPVNIDLALAQIAEMESKQNNALSEKASEKGCMTWNERINQMTVEEKAKWLYDMDVCRVSSISIEECNSCRHCTECMKNLLNSPYTEGANQ